MILFKSVLFGLSWGLLQGIVMYGPNLRSHDAFYMYHLFSVVVLISFNSLFEDLKKRTNVSTSRTDPITNVLFFVGVMVLLWEFSEIGYRLARYDINGWYEHICFFDVISIYLTGYKVALLHIARSLISILLIWRFK